MLLCAAHCWAASHQTWPLHGWVKTLVLWLYLRHSSLHNEQQLAYLEVSAVALSFTWTLWSAINLCSLLVWVRPGNALTSHLSLSPGSFPWVSFPCLTGWGWRTVWQAPSDHSTIRGAARPRSGKSSLIPWATHHTRLNGSKEWAKLNPKGSKILRNHYLLWSCLSHLSPQPPSPSSPWQQAGETPPSRPLAGDFCNCFLKSL